MRRQCRSRRSGHEAPATTEGSSGSQQGETSQQRDGSCEGKGGRGGQDGPGGHEHTAVTGDELTKVTEAVTAKYPDVQVQEVRKDPDGSYDVMAGTDDDRTMYEVSADLQTITEREGGPHGPRGERDGSSDDSSDDSDSSATESSAA